MNYGICPLTVVPVRSTNSDKSEMISQLLFGEGYEILSDKPNWLKIRCLHDHYEGWIDAKQHQSITEAYAKSYISQASFCLEWMQPAMGENRAIPLVMGSTLPKYDGLQFKLVKEVFAFSGKVMSPSTQSTTRKNICMVARKYLHAPYLWGGRSPFGIDCSGFSQVVFSMNGIQLPRDSSEQILNGEVVHFAKEAAPGDLAFFKNKKGRIVHVGIVLEEGEIIHASGKVRIDKLDHHGIYNRETSKYSHYLAVIKRLFSEEQSQSSTEMESENDFERYTINP